MLFAVAYHMRSGTVSTMATISRQGTSYRSWKITDDDVDVHLTIFEDHTVVYAPIQPESLKYNPVPDSPYFAAV